MPLTISRAVRRTGLLGTALLAVATLTACGANFDAQTLQPYQAAEGTNANSGAIALRNALVLADEHGEGKLYAGLVNTGGEADRLTTIRSEDPAIKVSGVRALTLEPSRLIQIPPVSDVTAAPTTSPTASASPTPGTSPTAGTSPTPGTTPAPGTSPTTGTSPASGTPSMPGESGTPAEKGADVVEIGGAKPGTMVRLTFVFADAAPITVAIPVLTTDHYSPTPPPAEGHSTGESGTDSGGEETSGHGG